VDIAFRKSFEKDLGKLRDETLLEKIKAEIEAVESLEISNETQKYRATNGAD
jgi:mRNA interferase RelE/StbE